MSPFLTVFVGGVLGGIASGVVIGLALVLFGRRLAEGLLERQIGLLETRFKENLLDLTLAKIAAFLDQGERLGQIVKRVVEILRLLLRHDAPDALTQGLGDIAAKPAAAPASAA